MVRHAVAFQFQQTAGTVVHSHIFHTVNDGQLSVALQDKAIVSYFVLSCQAPVGQMGLADKDGRYQVAVIGIEERVD